MEAGPRTVYLEYARDALGMLEADIHLYAEGARARYRAVAVVLRMLLCDTTRQHGQIVDISLAGRLWPDLTLHPLHAGGQPIRFDPDGARLSRESWLEQRFTTNDGQTLTLRKAIRLVCDRDGGAHVDPPVERSLPDLAGAVIAIGRYITQELEGLVR